MLIPVTAIFIGFALLMWSADRLVIGAGALARNAGVSPLIIGLTIVGFGTSAPEMLVSAMAAWSDNPNLGIGNAIGSNITNIALVLGAAAVIAPMSVHSKVLRREFPLLFIIMILALLLLVDRQLGRIDGAVLLIGLLLLIYWMTRLGLKENRQRDPMASEFASEIPLHMPTARALSWLALGLLLLLASSRLLVWGAVEVAHLLGISDLVIGLTVVAVGTSLPELAASIISARKGEHDIAIGNVMGSNMFNLLAVMGLPGIIQPSEVPLMVLERDFPVMATLTIGLFAMAYGLGGHNRISRFDGILLLLSFAGYQALLFFTEH